MIKGVSRRRSLFAFMLAIAMVFSFMMTGLEVRADVGDVGAFSKAVREKMIGSGSAYAGNKYEISGGGTYVPTNLLTNDDIVKIDESTYNQLKSNAKTEFLEDLDKAAKEVIKNNTTLYNDETLSNWYAILQEQDGVGTKMLNMILANTKPDFVAANKIYQPFSGIVGTALGLGAVLIMAFLTIVMVCDIAYITLPPMRLFAGEENERSGIKSKLFSHDATYAVQQAENSDSGNGSPKQALGIYFKRRVFMLILLGICLMYLVQGEIFTLIAKLLDLLGGFKLD